MKQQLSGSWALVTGASSGLGVDFARELAARGANLVLVARREDRLNAVAEEIRTAHGVEVDVLALDLGTPEAPEELFSRVAALGQSIDVLVNNAGFGVFGLFLDTPWERVHTMLELDIVNLVHLTRLFTRPMVERGKGWVLQVSSIGGYQPSPTYAAYAAAKAFVLKLGEALDFELRGTGVSCTVVSPGVTATEFLQVSGQAPTLYQRLVMMKSPDVARAGVDAMLRRRRSIVTGIVNTLSVWSMRLVPRRLQALAAYWMMKTPDLERPALPG